MQTARSSTFGNFSRPARPGIWGLGQLGTIVVVGGMAVAAVGIWISFWVSLTVLVLVLVVLGLLAGRWQDLNFGQRLVRRMAWLTSRRRGENVYRSGLMAPVVSLSHRLPGLAAASVLHSGHDAYGRVFAVLEHPAVGHWAVVLRCEPDGVGLVDQSTIEQRVAGYADFLAALADEPGIVGATVTVESVPDPGTRVSAEVSRLTRPDAPELAREVMGQIRRRYPAGGAMLRSTVAVVYSPGPRQLGRGRAGSEVDGIRAELGARIPLLCRLLSEAGAGAVAPMAPTELTELVHAAYDPAAEPHIARARLGGGSGLSWDNAGPVAAQSSWSSYRHDSGCSRTWSMWDAPRGHVLASVLARLLDAHPDVPRKRVSLIYRPYTASQATEQVETDMRDALFAAHEDSGISARVRMRVRAAEQTADEEARGAGVERFSLLVTATAPSPDALEFVAATVASLGGRVRLRPCYAAQDSAFAANLPIGVILPYYAVTPAFLRDAL